jgi:ectoine hydroxylase-related dioxygenase (phytanoyl-CoA dioxygenase family)
VLPSCGRVLSGTRVAGYPPRLAAPLPSMDIHSAAAALDREKVRRAIDQDGFIVIEDVLSTEYITRAKPALEAAIAKECEYHKTVDHKDYGMVLLCSLYGAVFLEPFDNDRLMTPFNAVLGDGCIVYAYTSSSMPAGGTNYSRRIHRDCPRVVPGYPTNMGATILLDDFTLENGATWFMPGSHRRATQDPPGEDEFVGSAKRLVARAGSIFFFDALLFHAGGENHSSHWRHALTINMCRPFMKQRLDIPRMMSNVDMTGASETVKQKLGFLSQVPASHDEYYAPPEMRKYRQPVE